MGTLPLPEPLLADAQPVYGATCSARRHCVETAWMPKTLQNMDIAELQLNAANFMSVAGAPDDPLPECAPWQLGRWRVPHLGTAGLPRGVEHGHVQLKV